MEVLSNGLSAFVTGTGDVQVGSYILDPDDHKALCARKPLPCGLATEYGKDGGGRIGSFDFSEEDLEKVAGLVKPKAKRASKSTAS